MSILILNIYYVSTNLQGLKNMSSREVIENKISYIKKQLRVLDKYREHSLSEILKNETMRSALERDLYLVIQGSIDLAEAIIAYKNLRKPTTMRESFHILLEGGLLSSAVNIEEFEKMIGFRNRLAHAYEKLDYEVLYDVLQNKLEQIEYFLTDIEKI